ncbi:IctB family putative bicarbonate transporter [Leptolyngbya sp. FACHB-8]|uniref:IctB family putative bicarbonate transporter n=1 Tax=unclassified Leptolyngbya TaxID=2650499 RepID=UPI001687228A|nr:IctB family putative bicarbonate transporter [Leptolyngbya sp. FACHB-8]MBD1911407.1 putative bicarbonate transporter, IctB family [Leptolyngbya sp. FACHB-8]
MTSAFNAVWQQLTFANGAPQDWVKYSYLHRLVGSLASWRQGSWLMQWGDTLGMGLAAILFCLAPFVSTALIGVMMLACGLYWAILTLSDEDGAGVTPIHMLVLLYWFISLIATAASPVKAGAAVGLMKLTLNVLLFLLLARVLRSPRLRSTLITLYLMTVSIVSVVGMRQWFFGANALATWVDTESTLAGTTRVYSFLGNPNLLASYLIPACIMSAAAVFAWQRWVPKALAVGLWVLNSACLVLTFSRGGWIGFVLSGFALLLLLVHWFSVYLPRFWRKWALPIVLGVTAAVVVAAVIAVDPLRDRVLSMFAGREDSSNNYRINVWAAVRRMIRDRPILGIGPGNTAFNKVYPSYQQTGYTALSAYSIYLEILVETGIIGFTCFLWLLTVTFTMGWERIQTLRAAGDRNGFWLMGAIATMIGVLSHGLVDTVWYRPQISSLWWLMLALVASYYLPITNRKPTEASTPSEL